MITRVGWVTGADGAPIGRCRQSCGGSSAAPALLDGKTVEEIGLDDGFTALTQLALLRAA